MASACPELLPPAVEIVPASLATLDAEDRGGAAVAALLGIAAPVSWPPAFNGPESRAGVRRLIAAYPHRPGFARWYIVAGGRLAGVCGCKGPPDASGAVEIGFAVLAGEQGKGIATAALERLLAFVSADPGVAAITAETLAPMLASQRLLLRHGFALAGEYHHFACGRVLRFRRLVR